MMLAVVAVLGAAACFAIGWFVAYRRFRTQLGDVAALADIPPDTPPEVVLDRVGRSVPRSSSAIEQARSDRDRFGEALGAVTQGVLMIELDGEVSYANEFARAFLGGRHGDALVDSAIQEIAERARREGSAEREVDLFGPPERTLLVSASALDGGDRVTALIDDVSESRRLDRVRRDFVANVSHELQTPVAAVSLLAETMEDETDPEVLRALAGRAHHEAFRVGRIIEDLLDVSRLERTSLTDVERLPIRVDDMITDAIAYVADLAEKRAVDIVVNPTELVADLDRVEMVSALRNLIENAVKYSGDSSRVEVRVAHHGGDLSIAVEDHGIGVPAQDVDHIFERFYRVDRGRSRSTGGTGLGLAIVRHVVGNHGGTVEVVSQEGSGSTFTVLLPGAIVANELTEDAS